MQNGRTDFRAASSFREVFAHVLQILLKLFDAYVEELRSSSGSLKALFSNLVASWTNSCNGNAGGPRKEVRKLASDCADCAEVGSESCTAKPGGKKRSEAAEAASGGSQR